MEESISVSELLQQWYAFKRADFAPSTRKVSEQAVRVLDEHFGPVSLNALKARHLDAWYAEMRAKGWSALYIKRVVSVLGTAFNCAVRWELAASNPVTISQLPRKNTARVQSPSSATVRAALQIAAANDPGLFAFIRLAAVSGARRSELLGLRREDLDVDIGTITIRRVVTVGDEGVAILERTKSARGAFTVSMSNETVKVLEKWLATHASEWIFPGRDPRRPLSPGFITHQVMRLGRLLGVPLRTHMLRHFAATMSLQSGTPITVVAHRLGDSVSTIQQVYAHSVAPTDSAAADALAATLHYLAQSA
jgi:integrase